MTFQKWKRKKYLEDNDIGPEPDKALVCWAKLTEALIRNKKVVLQMGEFRYPRTTA